MHQLNGEHPDDFELGGIALGTILVLVFFHMVNVGRRSGAPGVAAEGGAPADYEPGHQPNDLRGSRPGTRKAGLGKR